MSVKPIVAVNYKAYPTSFGKKGLEIAKQADEVAKELGGAVEIIVIPPFTELRTIAEAVEIPVFAQHADAVKLGAATGHIPPEIIKDTGAAGILLNHSENRIRVDQIDYVVKKAKELGLRTLVCANTPEVSASVAALRPDIVAVEPPELIGTGIPVSKAKPEIIIGTVNEVRKVNKDVIILTGAGITKGEDVEAAIKLGTLGVLVASAVMKAKNPKQVIKDMAEAALRALQK